jgi:hypothetical protein
MFDTFTFETSKKKPDPRWQAARRFARALRSEGFLARRHFIDRIAERGWGSGVRFDPRTFRSEFFRAAHYRQTRPGYNTRIAVVRGVPILYRVGGRSGKHIVLAGALPPNSPLPPSERTTPPRQGEVDPMLESEFTEEEEIWRRRGRLRGSPRRIPPRHRPLQRPIGLRRPIYSLPQPTLISGDSDGSGADEVLGLLIRAKTAIMEAAFAERERRDRKLAERSVRLALDTLRKLPSTWRTVIEGPLEEALNSLRLNNSERFRTFMTRALSRAREAMEDRKSYFGRF